MSVQPLTLNRLYSGWENYQKLLVEVVAPLTPEQLALRPAPHLRSIYDLVAHIIACRAGWFHEHLREGGPEFEEIAQWDLEDQPLRNAADFERGLEVTWKLINDCLTRWTPDDFDVAFESSGETQTRQWVLWHVIEHDLHHGGELSLTLGMHHLRAPDL